MTLSSPWASYSFRQAQGEKELELKTPEGHTYVLAWARYDVDKRGWTCYELCDEAHRHYLGGSESHGGSVSHSFFPTAFLLTAAFQEVLDDEGLSPLDAEMASDELQRLCSAVQAWTVVDGLEGRCPGFDLNLSYFTPSGDLRTA